MSALLTEFLVLLKHPVLDEILFGLDAVLGAEPLPQRRIRGKLMERQGKRVGAPARDDKRPVYRRDHAADSLAWPSRSNSVQSIVSPVVV